MLLHHWQRKRKNRSAAMPVSCPNFATVILDDRLADRQAHSQPGRLGREERFENPREGFRVDPEAAVGDFNNHHLFIEPTAEAYLPGPTFIGRRGPLGIQQKIHDDLLNAGTVEHQRRQGPAKIQLERHSVGFHLVPQQGCGLFDRVIEIGRSVLGHPIGATGWILIGTVLDELERLDKQVGLITMCAGGGMAPAVIIERV